MPLQPRTTLGRYEISSLVGEGGMGEVYLAEDKLLRRKVAIKLLLTDFAADLELLARFVREAHAASSLSHPNILTIYEIGVENGMNFIAAEFVEGESLRQLMGGLAPLELGGILDIGVQAASALAAAHAARIVHRDIKPENIMVRADGIVKVLDFGLAKFIKRASVAPDAETQADDMYKTAAGMVMGTVIYMSPEQARGLELDERTDVWSLGVVLYEMLTGKQPFAGDTMTDVLASIIRSEVAPPSDMAPGLPAELDRIILKTLSKDREGRYRSAQALLAELRQLQKRLEFEAELARTNRSHPPSMAHPGTQKNRITEEQATARTMQIEAVTQNIRNSIAVLPFVNTSADAENEYFCDGLAEELLNALAKIEELKVAARTSAFSFKGKDINVSQIARTLNVDTVLEGSVRKSGTRLRIMVRLVNAADGFQLWSERYDREMQDIFDVQDEITLSVVDALKVQLLGEEKAVVLKRYTDNTEAYELYLKGRFHYNKHTPEGWMKAIRYYEQAIEIEPEYAPAYAAMTSALVFAWFFGVLPPRETIAKCKAAGRRALEMDDHLDESHCALGRIGFYYEWDWMKGERGYRRGIEINPSSAQGHLGLGMILVSRERFVDAIVEGRRAVELDPLSLVTNLYMGWIYYFSDRAEDALRQVRKMLEIEPYFHGAYWLQGTVYLTRGRYDEAVEALEKAQKLGGNPIAKGYLGCAYARAGKREAALGVLDQLLALREQQRSEAFTIARVYGALGDQDKTFEWLSKAIDERNGEIVLFDVGSKVEKGHVWGENFRTDPRFAHLLRRIRSSSGAHAHEVESPDQSSESATQIFKSVK